jgi:hypothetical protein
MFLLLDNIFFNIGSAEGTERGQKGMRRAALGTCFLSEATYDCHSFILTLTEQA